MVVVSIFSWIDWSVCKWTSNSVDDKCNVIPRPYRGPEQDSLLKDLRKALYALSFVPPILSMVITVMLFVALKHYKNLRKSRNIIIAAFILGFAMPFLLQFIPYRTFVDFKAYFRGMQINADPASDDFGDKCTEGAACLSFTTLCKVAQGNFEGINLPAGLNQADATKVANNICADFFRTPCNLKFWDGKKNQMSLDCDKIETYATLFWETFVGGIFGSVTTKLLAPAVMSLIPGIAKGAIISKILLPNSAMVGYLVLAKPVFYTPLFLAFAIGIFQAIGDVFFALSMIFLALGQAGFLAFGRDVVDAMTYSNSQISMKKSKKMSLICLVLALLFLLLSIFTRTSFFKRLDELGIPAFSIEAMQMIRMLISTLANMFLSTLTFLDIVVAIVVGCYHSEQKFLNSEMGELLLLLLFSCFLFPALFLFFFRLLVIASFIMVNPFSPPLPPSFHLQRKIVS